MCEFNPMATKATKRSTSTTRRGASAKKSSTRSGGARKTAKTSGRTSARGSTSARGAAKGGSTIRRGSTGKGRSTARGSNTSGGGSSAGSSKTTTNHDQIRRWAEARGGRPACVQGTDGGGDEGVIRLMFPNAPQSNDDSLNEIDWDEWFEKFDESGLALVYQDKTAGGRPSNFNKLVSRRGSGGRGR